MKARHGAVFILLVGLQPLAVQAWYDKVHASLVRAAAEVVRRMDRSAVLYPELYAGEFLRQMGRGAWREDRDPPVDGNERAMRHYYDPDAKSQPVPRPTKGLAYFSFFRLWTLLEAGSEVAPPPGGTYDGAMPWALDGGTSSGNAFDWKSAVRAYGSGTVQGKAEAYFRLGHVLHLLGDMSVPDHAFNMPHPGSGKYLPDDIDRFFSGLMSEFIRWIGKQVPVSARILELGSAALEEMAANILRAELRRTYGNRPVRLIGFEGLIEDCIEPSALAEFFVGREREFLPRREPGLPALSFDGAAVPAHSAFQPFFDTLARTAKNRQLESGIPLALGCAKLNPYILKILAQKLGEGPAVVAWANAPILQEPLFFIPTINERDPESVRPFVRLGEPLLREAAAYTAGLMMHFQDIVNEPPFVAMVKVSQSPDRYYWGSWEDAGTADMPTGRTAELFGNILRPDVPKTFPVLTGRTLVQKTDTPLWSGRPAQVEISFGPISKWRDMNLVKRIDSALVKVLIDGRPVAGQMSGSNVWTGQFTPRLNPDGPDRTFRIVIEARDLHRHHPRPGLPPRGYALDDYPATIARASAELPDYPWEDYSPGVDKHHAFFVTQPESDEPFRPLPPPNVDKDPGWEGSWTVISEHTQGAAKGRRVTWSFLVLKQNDRYFVETREGRFPASVSGHTLRWQGAGGGNLVNVELTRDGDSCSGSFGGRNIRSNDPIAGTYTGRRSKTPEH
jgi:hypothetical protein